MSRVRQTAEQKKGRQLPQGDKVHVEVKASAQGSMGSKKSKQK